MNFIKTSFFSLTFFSFSVLVQGATLTLISEMGLCRPYIKFEGEIQLGDSTKLEKMMFDAEKNCDKPNVPLKTILLSSKGGDVNEAINIGRVIRKYEYESMLVPLFDGNIQYGCMSSCVLAFAGGVHRASEFGVLGIHRPYFTQVNSSDMSMEKIREQREKLNASIRAYLNEMDVSNKLLDDMLAIPPDKMKILTKDEKKMYRLIGYDTNYDELVTARQAKVYKMSSAQFRQREAEVLKLCPYTLKEFGVCYVSNMLNVSKEEAKIRIQKNSDCRKKSNDFQNCALTSFN